MDGGSPDLVDGLVDDKERMVLVKKIRVRGENYAVRVLYVDPPGSFRPIDPELDILH